MIYCVEVPYHMRYSEKFYWNFKAKNLEDVLGNVCFGKNCGNFKISISTMQTVHKNSKSFHDNNFFRTLKISFFGNNNITLLSN